MTDPAVAALTVGEFLLLGRLGLRPAGLALGCTVFLDQTDDPVAPEVSGELTGRTSVLYQAVDLALARLVADARELRADGVVGVRFAVHRSDRRHPAQVTFHGTAVAARPGEDAVPGAPSTGWRRPDGDPFTTTLTGEDLWLLVQGGYLPRAVVLGYSAVQVGGDEHRPQDEIGAPGAGLDPAAAEYTGHTELAYLAREHVVARMQDQARQAGATEVLAAGVVELPDLTTGRVAHFLTVGDAVAAYRDDHSSPAFDVVLPVQDG